MTHRPRGVGPRRMLVRINNSRSLPLRAGTATMLTVLAVAAGFTAVEKKNLDITIHGQNVHVVTLSPTVGTAIRAAGLTVDVNDIVTPSLSTRVDDGMMVRIGRDTETAASRFLSDTDDLSQQLDVSGVDSRGGAGRAQDTGGGFSFLTHLFHRDDPGVAGGGVSPVSPRGAVVTSVVPTERPAGDLTRGAGVSEPAVRATTSPASAPAVAPRVSTSSTPAAPAAPSTHVATVEPAAQATHALVVPPVAQPTSAAAPVPRHTAPAPVAPIAPPVVAQPTGPAPVPCQPGVGVAVIGGQVVPGNANDPVALARAQAEAARRASLGQLAHNCPQ